MTREPASGVSSRSRGGGAAALTGAASRGRARWRRPRGSGCERPMPRTGPRSRGADCQATRRGGARPAARRRRRSLRDVTDGILLIDKPAGKTSHDIVAAVRREYRGRRVGHAGTLDPFATGLLLVLVGRATRVQRYLMALPKRYETVARLGYVSTTGDTDGEITQTGNVPSDPPPLPTGDLLQRPHPYSAVKVNGRRAYELARAGEEVELDARPITVYRFEQLWREAERAAFAIECSAGTYVRTLVADLGDAYCEQLRRTAIGPFEVAGADPARLVP